MSLNTFQQISGENYRRLEEYIERLRDAGLKLPSRAGKVNKTAVATACGFNRETFTQNKRFEKVLDEAVAELGLDIPAKAPDAVPKDSRDKSRILRLEQQLAGSKPVKFCKDEAPIPRLAPRREGRRSCELIDRIWESEIVPMLRATPGLRPVVVLRQIYDRYPEIGQGVRRTIQRRVRRWHDENAPDPSEVLRHRPSMDQRSWPYPIFCDAHIKEH
jgi:hypothetical protein